MRKQSLIGAAVLVLASSVPVFAQNSLTVNSPGLGGTNNKLMINVEDDCGANDTPVYVESSEPNDETHIKLQFRLKAETLEAPASGSGRAFRFLNIQDKDDLANPFVILFAQRQASNGNNWRLTSWIRDTQTPAWQYVGSFFLFGYQTVADILVECEWWASTGGNTARLKCSKVGTGQVFDSGTTLPTQNRTADAVQVGFFDYDGFGNVSLCQASGALEFDEYASFR